MVGLKAVSNFLARWTIVGIVTALLSLSWVATSRAQNFERYRPRTPDSRSGESTLPEEPGEATGNEEVLVDQWLAIVVLDHQDQVSSEAIEAQGVDVRGTRGLTVMRSQAFARLASRYLGGPISRLRLNELVREIILLYRRSDQPVVDVSIPEQDITSGVVQIVVTEGRVGKVHMKGAQYFNPRMLLNQTDVSRLKYPIYESRLLEDLRWLNRNPFREVDLELAPGEEQGETDVIFNVYDRLPWRIYAGYEDTGTQSTGIERTYYGLNWGNAFGLDHQAGYQYTASSNFNSLSAHSGVYEIPLRNRDTLTFYGSYARVNSVLALPTSQSGFGWQSSLRYRYNLRDYGNYQHYFNGGFDFKQTNTNLEFGGVRVFDSTADIAQIAGGYHGQYYSDHYGSFRLGADLFVSPAGGFSPNNSNTAYNVIRQGATADYLYSRMYFDRQIDLPLGLQWNGHVTGQIAEGNLLPSEQLGFGGFDSIRGYDMRIVNGDSGLFVNLELGTQPINLGGRDGQLQMYTFLDFGESYVHTAFFPFRNNVKMSSVGVGSRYVLSPNFSLRLDYGHQMNRVSLGLPGSGRDRIHLGVVLSPGGRFDRR